MSYGIIELLIPRNIIKSLLTVACVGVLSLSGCGGPDMSKPNGPQNNGGVQRPVPTLTADEIIRMLETDPTFAERVLCEVDKKQSNVLHCKDPKTNTEFTVVGLYAGENGRVGPIDFKPSTPGR